MQDYKPSLNCEAEVRRFIDEVTGEIQIQDICSESLVPQGVRGSNLTRQQVKNNPHKAARFVKSFNLGAHRMVQCSLFNRATRVLMYLQRESVFGGKVYTTVRIISEEIGTDEANIRKILKQLEEESFIMHIDSNNGGKTILLNPNYFMAGDELDEESAMRLWNKERNKRLKATGAAKKRP